MKKTILAIFSLALVSTSAFSMKLKWKCSQGDAIFGTAVIYTEEETATVYPFDIAPYTLSKGQWEIEYNTQENVLGVAKATISDLVNEQTWQCSAALVPAAGAVKSIIPGPVPPISDVEKGLECYTIGGIFNVNLLVNGSAQILMNQSVIEVLSASEFEIQDTILAGVMFVNLKNNSRSYCNVK